jgi:hypothetical protein
MRFRRLFARTICIAVAALAMVGAAVLLQAAPASAQAVWVEVNPSSVQAGMQVNIRASCGDNTNQATVRSDAFGTVVVSPQNGLLVGDATVPGDRRAGAFEVRLRCANGSTATTTLNVVNMARPTRGQATGGGGTAGGGGGGLVLAGGLATVAIGVAMGLVAVRRRRSELSR